MLGDAANDHFSEVDEIETVEIFRVRIGALVLLAAAHIISGQASRIPNRDIDFSAK